MRPSLLIPLMLLSGFVSGAQAALPIEKLQSGGTLPSSNGHRIYVSDLAITHAVDSKVHIVDGDTLRYLGQLSAGAGGLLAVSPDNSELYVSTTYIAKLTRGERIDQVDVYSAAGLRLLAEIPLPPKRALSVPYNSLTALSGDGRLLFIQNATPATSVSVVDVKQRKFLMEIATPGCYGLFAPPASPSRVATLCGDGTLMTITMKADGSPPARGRSAKFFDADKDPVFITAGNDANKFFFVSFQGRVYPADLSGETATVGESWSLVSTDEQSSGWRPGGYQMTAVQGATGKLYVGMHNHGGEGSHKMPAEEIWGFDFRSHKRVTRVATEAPVMAISVSGDSNARLYAIELGKNGIMTYDARGELKLLQKVDGFGDSPLALQVH